MTIASQILKHAEDQYRALIDKSVSKRKFRPAPKLVEMFNFKSDESNKGFGFPLYKNLIQQAWHPVTDFNGHKIVVWDVAFMCCDFVDARYELYICNKLEPENTTHKQFKSAYERECYMDEIYVVFNEGNHLIKIYEPEPTTWAHKFAMMERKKHLLSELETI